MRNKLKRAEKKPICNKLTSEELETMFMRVINQQTFKYSFRDTMQYFYRFIGFRQRKYLEKDFKLKKHIYYQRGEKLLMNDLDIVKLVKRLHTIDVEQQIKWNMNEQLLLALQKRKVIDSQTDVDDEIAPERLRSSMLSFQDEKARREFKLKVRKALGFYKDKELNETEIRILFGLRSRNIKKQEEMITKKDFGDNIKKQFFAKKAKEVEALQKCVSAMHNRKRRSSET